MPRQAPPAPVAPTSRSGRSPAATLGDLPFDLSAAELRRRAEAGLARAQHDLDGLVGQGGSRTVSGFLEPLDRVLARVRDIGSQGSLIFAVHADPATRTAGREVSEAADRFYHGFRLNADAYAALRAVDLSNEDDLTRFAAEKLLREMRRSGVEKDAATRRRLLELNQQIDVTANRFSENIANQERSLVLDSVDELAGLPPDYLAAHRPDAAGKVQITTKYPDFLPVMAYADRGDVRRRLLYEFSNRAYPANMAVLDELVRRRHEFARLLGYPSFAAYAIEDKMLERPEAVRQLLDRLAALLRDPARADLARFLARKRKDEPQATRLEPWEAQLYGPGYYDQKIRIEEFGVDLRELRTYLPYGKVRDGLFALCQELFGIGFVRSAAPAWHPAVEVYDVSRGGKPLGRVYLDLTPRDGKFNHAACFAVREGLAGVQLPQSALICNFLDPSSPAETTRMEYSEVVTFFHEFGHLLHALLSGHQRWLYNSQSNLEWDFIEAPSQLFEEWARDPATLSRFAVDPDRGRRVPRELLERLKASEALGRPLRWLRQAALASISLELYTGDPQGRDVSETARAAWARYAPEPMPPEYHMVAAFGHLTGYSACYYTYPWSAVIARDLLSPFFAAGTLTDPKSAARYAGEILSPGSERHARELIRAYLGREFNYEAFESWVAARAQPASGRPVIRRASAARRPRRAPPARPRRPRAAARRRSDRHAGRR